MREANVFAMLYNLSNFIKQVNQKKNRYRESGSEEGKHSARTAEAQDLTHPRADGLKEMVLKWIQSVQRI